MTRVNENESNICGSNRSPSGLPQQDENGVDLSLIRENLRLTPVERVRRADRARRDALRLMEYGRRNPTQRT